MPEYLAPGVYVEETSFRAKPIEGVGTSTTGMVGPTRRGPLTGTPEPVTSVGEFERVFGGVAPLDFDGEGERVNHLAHAVRGFFDNGGSRLYVARVFTATDPGDPRSGHASATVLDAGPDQVAIEARMPGAVGNGVVSVTERAVRATWRRLHEAPVGSVALVGGGTAPQPAFALGGFPPFSVAPGSAVNVATAGPSADVVFTATRAQITGAAVGDPGSVDIVSPASDTLSVTINGREQTIGLPVGNTTLQALAEHINLEIRGASVTVVGGGSDQLRIASEIVGSDGSVAITAENAALGLSTASDIGSGVGDTAALTLDDINWAIGQTGLAGVVSASIDPATGRLRLATVATGAGETIAIADPGGPPSARSALSLPSGAGTGGQAGANLTVYVKGATSWSDSGGGQLPPPAPGELEPSGGARLVTATVETRDGDGTARVYEGLGYGAAHPRAILSVLASEPARTVDALTSLFAVTASGSVTPFVLRTALVGAGAAGGASAAAGPHGVYALTGGDDGAAPTAASYGTALDRLAEVEGISIVAAPGSSYLASNSPAVLTNARAIRDQIVTHVEADTRYRIAVLDVPQDRTIEEARSWRGEMDSKYAALYHPWLVVANPLTRPGDATIPTELVVPPSGHICGIYARNDAERGVHKAPANEVVRGIVRFAQSINHAQQELLNPDGINCLRAFSGRGQRVWGARLASSDNEWRYVSDRRYFNYLEASIDRGTQWAVFEPNGDALWADVEQSISEFLYNEWRSGALLGKNPNEAYTVRCDRSVMTQNDLDNGRMICEIGVAIVKPAEFVIFRIGQKTIDAHN